MSSGLRKLLNRVPTFRRRVLLVRLAYLAWRREATINVDIPRGVYVGKRIALDVKPKVTMSISIGRRSRLGDNVILRLHGGEIRIGEDVDIRSGCVINMGGGILQIDGPNNLSWYVTVHCAESIHLERFAHVAEFSTIVDSSHFYTEEDVWSHTNSKSAPVALGVDVWVCPKSTITSGVTIGDHTIVGSNTVVVKDVASGVLVSGIPAKVVRELDLPWKR